MEDPETTLDDRMKAYDYFGTFTRSWLSLCELTLGNWVPIARFLVGRVSEFFLIPVLLYVLCVTFAVMRVITACFIYETQKVASTDPELAILQKQRTTARLKKNFKRVFDDLDQSGDGMVNWDE